MVGIGEISLITLLTLISSFLIFYYYWDIDKQTESFDNKCRDEISEKEEFRGLSESHHRNLIVTSDSRTSKARSSLLKISGKLSDLPDEIIVLEEHSKSSRQKQIILENCRNIPGKAIIDQELVSCIRNYYAYKLSLSLDEADFDIVSHFKEKFEEHDHSNRIYNLGKNESYQEVTLMDIEEDNRNILDDVFLPILKGAENHCVRPVSNSDKAIQEIENCKKHMMFSFWELHRGNMRGIEVDVSSDNNELTNRLRSDLRNGDNVAYWILAEENCTENLFGKFKNLGYRTTKVLNDYWGDGNYSILHPPSDSIPRMEYIPIPFIIFKKDLEEFQGGPKHTRIKDDPRYRRKRDHQ